MAIPSLKSRWFLFFWTRTGDFRHVRQSDLFMELFSRLSIWREPMQSRDVVAEVVVSMVSDAGRSGAAKAQAQTRTGIVLHRKPPEHW